MDFRSSIRVFYAHLFLFIYLFFVVFLNELIHRIINVDLIAIKTRIKMKWSVNDIEWIGYNVGGHVCNYGHFLCGSEWPYRIGSDRLTDGRTHVRCYKLLSIAAIALARRSWRSSSFLVSAVDWSFDETNSNFTDFKYFVVFLFDWIWFQVLNCIFIWF